MIEKSQQLLSLFDADGFSDEEVARELRVQARPEFRKSLPKSDKPLNESGKDFVKGDKQPYDAALFLEAPSDQPDLFEKLPTYDLLPEEWQDKNLWSWADDDRYVPIEIAISAVFTIGNNKIPRLSFNREQIPILNKNYSLYYTGLELRQADELIWLQLLHLNRGKQPLGSPVMFKPAAFLRELDLTTAAANYQHLKEAMHRLMATSLELYSHKYKKSKTFRLVCHFDFEDENHYPLPAWKVVLDPRLFYLLQGRYHGRISFKRRKLLGNGLASKLHSYFACHSKPIPRNIDDYFQLCVGNEEVLTKRFLQQRRLKATSADSLISAQKAIAQKRREFKYDMKEALDRLCSKEIGFLRSYTFYKRSGEVFVSVERHDTDNMENLLGSIQEDVALSSGVLVE